MTDATYIPVPRLKRSTRQADPIRLPKPQPFGAPVLIYDCVTPLGGETLLSLLMKKMAEKDDQAP